MKANEAPQKLYYAPYGDIRENHPITDNDIEYIRADVFIEKAKKWIKDNGYMYNGDCKGDVKAMAEDFVNFMKGE